MRRSGCVRCAAALLTLAMAAACGGSDDAAEDSTDTTEATADENTGAVESQTVDAEVPESLEFLGDIPTPEEAHVVSFGTEAGEFTFGDGTRVEVPPGAFGGPTDVLSVRVSLDFEQYDPGSTSGAAYVLSTAGAVDLAEPIHLELATGGVVKQLRDGEWETFEGTRIAIEHFSEVPTVVVPRQPDADPADVEAAEGNTDAEFLFVCLRFLGDTLFNDDEGARGVGVQWAYKICTRALIERYEPGDVYVSTACVGDKIDGSDLRAAVDECVAEARAAEEAGGDDADDGGEQADPPPPEDGEPDAPVPDSGATAVGFTGSLETEGATLEIDWEVPVSDGSGTGTGVVVLTGPCTEGIDGQPGGEVIEADITATIAFEANVTIEDDILTLTTGGFEITAYTGRDQACREAFTAGLTALGPLLDGSVGAESGPVSIGGFAGELTVG